MTTLTFKNEHGEYSVTVREDEMRLIDVIERLLIPAMKAAEYNTEKLELAIAQMEKSK